MNCVSCNSLLKEESNFCGICGHLVKEKSVGDIVDEQKNREYQFEYDRHL